MKDYGEPWMENQDGAIVQSDGKTFVFRDDQAARMLSCVNACAGIPDAELPNVRKALCASELLNHGWYKPENIPSNFKDFGGSFQDYLVGMANASIDSGRTFGELDQLIRECR